LKVVPLRPSGLDARTGRTLWRNWRYRRATLARLLAREGMMQQMGDAYIVAMDFPGALNSQ